MQFCINHSVTPRKAVYGRREPVYGPGSPYTAPGNLYMAPGGPYTALGGRIRLPGGCIRAPGGRIRPPGARIRPPGARSILKKEQSRDRSYYIAYLGGLDKHHLHQSHSPSFGRAVAGLRAAGRVGWDGAQLDTRRSFCWRQFGHALAVQCSSVHVVEEHKCSAICNSHSPKTLARQILPMLAIKYI